MTKKKNSRPKHQKDVSFADTSEEEFNSVSIQGKSCAHVARGIHFGRVKKCLKSSQNIVTCNGCSNENSDVEELPEVWLCLQCGYRGCGRTSENKHGLQHFKTLHSDCHSLVLSTLSGSVWCYECDDEISLQASRVLKQCVEFVMKMKPNAPNKSNVLSASKVVTQQNLQISVIKEETNVQNSEDNRPVEKMKKPIKNKEISQKIPIKGLRNLGNTCFFNAVMQNLNQTSLLYFELKNTCTPSHLWEVPELVFMNNDVIEGSNDEIIKLSLPQQLPLTKSFLNFFEQMSYVSSAKVDVIDPSPLFGEISRKCPQFRHYQQQDSHELLRQLLDGVRQEEMKRQKKAILRYFDLENVSPENVDDEMKKQIKAYGCYASHTIVEKVFGGLLISTVLCEECKMSSQVFEPFMDLSLPLFEEKQQENNEQRYGMLDGGKQDHIKPLRNKKAEWDSGENSPGEYVLTKPKNDMNKPSKHQEKKQKQLARKEKKRAKYSGKNKKSFPNEPCDDSINEVNEIKEDEIEEENNKDIEEENSKDIKEEKDKDIDESINIDHENEVWEVKELFASDEENSKIDAKSPPQSSSHNTENHIKLENQNMEISADIEMVQVCETNENSFSLPHTSTGENELEQPDTLMDVEQADNSTVTVIQKCDEDECPENQNKAAEEVSHESTESESKETEAITDDMPYLDDSLKSITEDFSSCLKISDSNQSNIDDRIHALSMLVKDVRIRRDSDHQENLLSSSESTDDCESQKTNCTSPKSSMEDSCSVDNCDNWSHSVSEQQTKDWISKTLTTLKARHHVSALECSIYSCLSHFTKPELLTGNNKFRCENCTELKIKRTGNKKEVVYSNASKQMLIFSPPAVLTLHLKRFQQVGMSLRKVNRFVEFPLILDLASFCCSACVILPHMSMVEDEILYSLYGVVEHSGRLTSGHYTAFVKANKRTFNQTFKCQLPLAQCDLEQLLRKFSGARCDSSQDNSEQAKEHCQWFYISDSHVNEVSEAQVLKCQAYLLFYERIK